jgi:hypothetical protein
LVEKGKLREQDTPPTRLVLEEARTIIPCKDIPEANVQGVLRYCYSIDFGIKLKKALHDPNDTSPLPKPFFKPLSKLGDFKSKKTVSDVITT